MIDDWQCPLCRSSEAGWLFDTTDAMNVTRSAFSVVECGRCGLFSINPRPAHEELLALYPQDYEPFWAPLDEEPNGLRRWLRRRHWGIRCRAVHRARPEGGRLLDIGCATGHFLHELCRDKHWQGVGIDINEGALEVARRQGVNVLLGELTKLSLPPASFDVVTIWEVIEHVPDPAKTLIEIHRILQPGGTLLLSTPNGQSLQARFWREHWHGWELPRHIQVFSSRTLHQLLVEKGFAPVRSLHFPLERFYAVASANRWLRLNHREHALTRSFVSVVGLTAWPIFRIIDHTRAASSIVLEARAEP